MACVEGFSGIRYSLADGRDVSDRLAPPYDTIATTQEKNRLLERSDHNIVAIDLPHIPPKQAGPEYVYKHAGELLNAWIDQKALTREVGPAVYLYRQIFDLGGERVVRRGFIARLRLEELSDGCVLPHEQTYSGPKQDRLLLTKFTKSNTSQIFCLYEDPDNEIADTLYGFAGQQPDYHGTLDGVENELWVLTERDSQHWMTDKMQDRDIVIADGHHRYSTSLLYRNYLASQGSIDQHHPANYVSCMFVSMSEPGLVVLPTHRAVLGLKQFSLDKLAASLGYSFSHKWVDTPAKPQQIETMISQISPQAFAFASGTDDRCLIAWPKDPEHLLDDLADEYNSAWRTLPVSILHKHILERVVFHEYLQGDKPSIEYFHRTAELLQFVRNTPDSLAVIVQATPVEAVRQVCADRMLMPQKSTFFYPKLATGAVIYPLFD